MAGTWNTVAHSNHPSLPFSPPFINTKIFFGWIFMSTFIDASSLSNGFMEDVQLWREAASQVTTLRIRVSTKAWVWDQGTWITSTHDNMKQLVYMGVPHLPVKPLRQICGDCVWECLKRLQECCYCHKGSSRLSGSIYLNLRPIVASVSLFLSPVAKCCVLTMLECRDPVSLHALTLYYLMI